MAHLFVVLRHGGSFCDHIASILSGPPPRSEFPVASHSRSLDSAALDFAPVSLAPVGRLTFLDFPDQQRHSETQRSTAYQTECDENG